MLKEQLFEGLQKFLGAIALAGGICFLLVYLVLAIFHMLYPFDIEWVEGAMVGQVNRILTGGKMYAAPSLEFVPAIYPPLYFYLSACVASVTGIGHFPLRLVSFLSSIGIMALIFQFVRRETNSVYYGLASACLFAATYRIGGAWIDLARVDALFLFFLLASVYCARFYDSTLSGIGTGVLLCLSFLTKQTAIIMFPFLALWLWLTDRKRAIAFVCTALALGAVSTAFLNWFYDGWYFYYIFELPSRHQAFWTGFYSFWLVDLGFRMPIAATMSIWYLIIQGIDRKWDAVGFFGLFLAGMSVLSWVARLHWGGYANVLIPVYAAICILSCISAKFLIDSLEGLLDRNRSRIAVLVALLGIGQFIQLGYAPWVYLPSQDDIHAGKQLVGRLGSTKGEVYIPYHGYLSEMAGKSSFAHHMNTWDVLRAGDTPVSTGLRNEIGDAISRRRFEVIILDQPGPREWVADDRVWLESLVRKAYGEPTNLFSEENLFWTRTGSKFRPQFLFSKPTESP